MRRHRQEKRVNGRQRRRGVLALSLVAVRCGDDDDAAPVTRRPRTMHGRTDDNRADGTAAPEATTAPDATDRARRTAAADGTTGRCDTPTPVKLQLQWFIQAQFAGYFAAIDQGFYEDYCLDVEILEGRRRHRAAAAARRRRGRLRASPGCRRRCRPARPGADIVNIAQIFQRSGTLQVSFADAGITSPDDFAGKKIGNWGFGNEYEIFAALTEAGLDPATDVELVQQQFDMLGLLAGDIDAAEAMTYNEYAQVLEAVNPDTGELYTPEDFNVISYEDVGVGMLQDAIWADAAKLESDDGLQRHRGRASSPPRSRAGRTAATTPRRAATSSSPPARSSATATSCGR